MPTQSEYRVAMGYGMGDIEKSHPEQSENTPTFTKKRGIWSGLKHMFNQRQRTPSRNRNERRQFSTDLSSLSYSCLGQARQEEEEMYGMNSQQRARLSRNMSMSHESVFQMEPLPSQSSEERLITPRTSSSTALPMMMHTELQAVLRQRQSRSRNFSKQSNDYTDDEDLGLPKSLQNSPGDFSDDLVGSSVLRSSGPWGASRHHSSCSDNSLLSLDSYDNKVDNDGGESRYYRDKSPGDVRNRSVSPGDSLVSKYPADGNLSHQAARHKMAIRPKRNHAVRHHRRLQQLEEVQEIQNQIISPSSGARDPSKNSSPVPSTFDNKGGYTESTNQMHYKSEEEHSDSKSEEMKTKSKSLDVSFRAMAPSASMLKEMSKDGNKKTKSKIKLEQEGSFLSRLFGSKRHKMKTSVSKTDLEDKAFKPKSQGQKLPTPDQSPSAPNLEPNPYKQAYYHPHDIMADANKLSPPKYKPSVKQKPPPPPPDSIPPSVRKSEEFSLGGNEIKDMQTGQRSVVPKSQSFRQNECLVISPGEPEYPSLPAQVSHADVILKKNKSMSSVLSAEASHQKFRSSIENWSFANEGLKKSIGSLADKPIMTSQSNESLKTISSLLEEPDLLEHTSVLDERISPLSNTRISENLSPVYSEEKSCISNEINSALTNRRPVMEDGFFTDSVHKNVITNVKIDDYKPTNDADKFTYESVTEIFTETENICNINDNRQDTMDDFHTKLKSSELTLGNCEGDSCTVTNQMRLYPCSVEHAEDSALSDGDKQAEENVCETNESKINEENTASDFVPKYQDEEVEKLIKLADNSTNFKLEQAENFSPTNTDNNQASLEIVESDFDLSAASSDVFHTPKSVNISQISFHTAADQSTLFEETKGEESFNPEKEIVLEESLETTETDTPVDLLQIMVKNSDDLEIKSEPVNHTPGLTKPPKPQRLQMDTGPSDTSDTQQNDELDESEKVLSGEENKLEDSSKPKVIVYKPILVEIQNNSIIDKESNKNQGNGELKTEDILTNKKIHRKSIDNSTQKIVNETKKPEISPKPVPAPRHFFLKKSTGSNQNDDPVLNVRPSESEKTELSNVFARRSKSSMVLGIDKVEKLNDVENSMDNDVQIDNSDIVINVKERAKSFSGTQTYQFGPKPFRPSSIAHEIRMTKPLNIPPKPKLAQKPVPAPRQFRSISNADVVSSNENYQKKVTKSGANLEEPEQKALVNETKSKTNLEIATSAGDILKTEVVTDVSANLARTDDVFTPKQPIKEEEIITHKLAIREEKITTTKQKTNEAKITVPKQIRNEDDNSKIKEDEVSNRVDPTNLEDIQVKKIVNNFQKSKSPEKPIRKFPPTRDVVGEDILSSLPLADLSAKDESSRNVMSIVTKLNAMSTTAVLQ